MNLFYDPSILGLRQLVDTADKSLSTHNIVIDFDGEVIIDPEKKYAGVELNRYKFCTKLNRSVLKSTKDLQSLFDTLITAYSGNRGDHGLQQTWKTAA